MNTSKVMLGRGQSPRLIGARFQAAFANIAVCLLVAFSFAGEARADEEIVISTRDGERTAIVLRAGRGPQPTVLVLHGGAGTANGASRTSGFADAAASRNFTAVFPQGLGRKWNDGRLDNPDSADDVEFLRTLVEELIDRRIAKPGHVYIAGISNGGMMSFAMACKAGKLFRGVGAIIANMPVNIRSCRRYRPMPLIMVNGTDDPLMPYTGGGVGFQAQRGDVMGAEETAELFARKNGCQSPRERSIPDRDETDNTVVTRITWSRCRSGKNVTLYRIEGGGHQIPGGRTMMRMIMGATNHDISAAEIIMSAFAREDARGKR